jgi:LPXTG-motif cell wall-anchored protein
MRSECTISTTQCVDGGRVRHYGDGVPLRPALRLLLAATLAFGALFLTSGAASAESNDDYVAQPPAAVAGATAERPAAAVRTAKVSQARTSNSDLPVTGTDVATLVVVGGGLVLAGGAVMVTRRRVAGNA